MELGVNAQSEVYSYSDQVVNWGGNAVHILFSIFCALLYCFLSEVFPKVKVFQGVIFGLILAFGAHGIIFPLFHLSAPVWQLHFDSILSEIIGTSFWMWTIEIVRRDPRNRITKKPDPEFQ